MATTKTPTQRHQEGSGSGGGGGSTAKPGTMRKPVFVKVNQLKPGTFGHTLTVKVLSSTTVLDKKSRNTMSFNRAPAGGGGHTRIAECLIGDETGTILFTARNDQEMWMQVDCPCCRIKLQLPPGGISILCPICHANFPIIYPQYSTTRSTYCPPYPYHQPPPLWLGQPPSVHGRRKAVICGILYRNSPRELKGCITDAKCFKFLLVNRFNFPESSIIMLTEEETDPYKQPTKRNIRMAMYWLVRGCQRGDSLVFYYSGHSSQQLDYTRNEIDGYNETLLPVDYKTQGVIVDNEINDAIVKPLPRGVKLHAIIDACHSGTMLDLPFLCRMNRSGRYVWEDHRPPSGVWKGTNGGEVISFSGCDDDQTSIDTAALSRGILTGAMTFSFIQAIERGHGTTYGNLLNSMRSTIRNTGNDLGIGVVASILSMLLTGESLDFRMRQEPQLTANELFDVYSKHFSL